MRKVLVTLFSVALLGAFAFAGTGTASAKACPPSSPQGGGSPSCGVDHNQPPPACDKSPQAQKNKNCPPPQPPPPPPPPGCQETGPISSIVAQIEAGIRNGGGGALADLIHQVNCQLIVGVLGL